MTNRTGKSQSIRPVSKRPPLWLTYGGDEVEAIIIKLAREGNSPSKIGELLRDQYGIPLTKPVLGDGITNVLKQADIEIEMPVEVIIQKCTAEPCQVIFQAGFRCYICEGSVTIIPVEYIRPPVGNPDILIAVI